MKIDPKRKVVFGRGSQEESSTREEPPKRKEVFGKECRFTRCHFLLLWKLLKKLLCPRGNEYPQLAQSAGAAHVAIYSEMELWPRQYLQKWLKVAS